MPRSTRYNTTTRGMHTSRRRWQVAGIVGGAILLLAVLALAMVGQPIGRAHAQLPPGVGPNNPPPNPPWLRPDRTVDMSKVPNDMKPYYQLPPSNEGPAGPEKYRNPAPVHNFPQPTPSPMPVPATPSR